MSESQNRVLIGDAECDEMIAALERRWMKESAMFNRLQLKPEPDGFGFYYGRLELPSGRVVDVNVLPPVAAWQGQLYVGEQRPHSTDWVAFINGTEMARAATRGDVETALLAYDEEQVR